MKSRLAALAIKDIDGILGSLARDSPTAANGFRVKIAEVRSFIEQFPESGRKTRRAGIRVVNSGRYPYLWFYRIFPTEIVILRVIHGARNPRGMPAKPR